MGKPVVGPILGEKFKGCLKNEDLKTLRPQKLQNELKTAKFFFWRECASYLKQSSSPSFTTTCFKVKTGWLAIFNWVTMLHVWPDIFISHRMKIGPVTVYA